MPHLQNLISAHAHNHGGDFSRQIFRGCHYVGLNSQSDGESMGFLLPALMTSITVRSITKSGKRKLPLVWHWNLVRHDDSLGTILDLSSIGLFISASTAARHFQRFDRLCKPSDLFQECFFGSTTCGPEYIKRIGARKLRQCQQIQCSTSVRRTWRPLILVKPCEKHSSGSCSHPF